MRFWLVIFAFVVIAGDSAEAQVFKPRGKAAAKTAKKAPGEKDTADKPAPPKKAARKTETPSRVAAKTKKSRAVETDDAADAPAETPKPGKGKKGAKAKGADVAVAPKDLGDDEVIITDDDD